jgi:hypothetical protein
MSNKNQISYKESLNKSEFQEWLASLVNSIKLLKLQK